MSPTAITMLSEVARDVRQGVDARIRLDRLHLELSKSADPVDQDLCALVSMVLRLPGRR